MREHILNDFLQTEISYQDWYDAIYNFIIDANIRSGEYEGNQYVIKKLDRLNFIVFAEDIFGENKKREIHSTFSLFRKELLIAINEYAKKSGFKVQGYGNESNDVLW